MRTIKIEVQVNDNEYELLRMGKCEQPNPQRMKIMLLSQAASNVRRMSEMVMQGLRERSSYDGARPVGIHAKAADLKQRKLDAARQVLAKARASREAAAEHKIERKANHVDWMDDDNIAKLKS